MISVAAVAWLAVTGRLGWYIHPRYVWFTVLLSAVAAVAVVAAVPVLHAASRRDDRGADQAHAAPQPARRVRFARATGTVLLIAGATGALIIAPPATLSTEVAQQRQLGAGDQPATALTDVPDAPTGPGPDAYPEETAKAWAGLLRSDGAELEGRAGAVSGFVLRDPDAASTFVVARFAVSCCVVDAQPLGVPVYDADAAGTLAEGAWVRVEGVFIANPDPAGSHPTVMRPAQITPIPEPEDPYVY